MPLGELLRKAEPLPNAKHAVFHCADIDDEGAAYYESMAVPTVTIPKRFWRTD